MPELSWARLKTDLHLGLRRGAWYRVIRETDSQVILDVDMLQLHPGCGLEQADLYIPVGDRHRPEHLGLRNPWIKVMDLRLAKELN